MTLPLCAGVGTENILDSYINAIKVLQKVDSNGLLTAAVTAPDQGVPTRAARHHPLRCQNAHSGPLLRAFKGYL